MNVLHASGLLLERIDFASVSVDQVEFFKWRLNFKRVERTSLYEFTCSFSHVRASASEPINVDRMQVPSFQNRAVCSCVLLQNIELQFGPFADFVQLGTFCRLTLHALDILRFIRP